MSKDTMIMIESKMKSITEKFHVRKVHGFYLSVLEHVWVIIVEADTPHEIEAMCIEAGISAFNTVKIVPLSNFDVVMNKIRGN